MAPADHSKADYELPEEADLLRTVYLEVAPDTPDAGSYTHLRANETVLELVCRLLLEKKK